MNRRTDREDSLYGILKHAFASCPCYGHKCTYCGETEARLRELSTGKICFIDDLAIKAYLSSTYTKEPRPQFQVGQAVVMVGEVLNKIRRISQRRWEADNDFNSWWYTLETDECQFDATGDHPICEKYLRPLSGNEIGLKYFEVWEPK